MSPIWTTRIIKDDPNKIVLAKSIDNDLIGVLKKFPIYRLFLLLQVQGYNE